MLFGCGDDGDGDQANDGTAAPTALSYAAGPAITIGTQVQWAPVVTGASATRYTVSPALPAGLVLDDSTGVISGAPTTARASTPYVVTASNTGGSVSYTLTFAVLPTSIGPLGEVKASGPAETPPIALSSSTPASGETLTVAVSVPGATLIDLAFAGNGCGALSNASAPAAALTQSGAVAASGQCQVTATATLTTGATQYSSEFTVAPSQRLAGQGLSLAGGTYFPSGDVALLGSSPDVAAGAIRVPQALINGGSASIYVAQTGSAKATRALVQVSGVPGYYIVPLVPDTTSNTYRIELLANADFLGQIAAGSAPNAVQALVARGAAARPANLPSASEPKAGAWLHAQDVHRMAVSGTTLTVTVSLVSPGGGVSAPVSATVPVQPVGSGPIQVSLSWAGAVDVDLHVTPPSGTDIYYGQRSDETGGTLDLDSNAGCAIDNVNNENIVWTAASRPAVGAYTVRVDYWSKCSSAASIPYTVRVTNCGVSTTYSGTLSADQADAGGAGSGIPVATIDYRSCSGLSVAGTARYDDYQPTSSGLSTMARPLPIRYAQVEIHQTADDSVLATGQTDENGSYSLTFAMATPGKYYVKVLAASDLAWATQKVLNTGNAIYAVKTPDLDASMTPNATGIDLGAKRGGSFAEAFNIFDLGISALKEVQARFGATLPALTWRWTAGQATCGGAASCYDKADNSIYVLSTAADTDEYDEPVLAHEFGHFVMRQLSRDDSPGGGHGFNQPTAPALPWSEGLPTFLGQRTLQTPTYIDTNAAGAFAFNVETVPSYVPAGTSDGTLSGNLSEGLVAAVLWDLADTGQDSRTVGGTVYKDTFSNPDAAYSVLKSWRGKTHDRGAAGADLVDFVDEWLCTVPQAAWEATPGNNFSGVISKLNGFPYLPPATPNCQ